MGVGQAKMQTQTYHGPTSAAGTEQGSRIRNATNHWDCWVHGGEDGVGGAGGAVGKVVQWFMVSTARATATATRTTAKTRHTSTHFGCNQQLRPSASSCRQRFLYPYKGYYHLYR